MVKARAAVADGGRWIYIKPLALRDVADPDHLAGDRRYLKSSIYEDPSIKKQHVK